MDRPHSAAELEDRRPPTADRVFKTAVCRLPSAVSLEDRGPRSTDDVFKETFSR